MRFRKFLKILSWVVGVSFTLIIILPSFDFKYVDELVKLFYFLALFTLVSFAFIEMFAEGIKLLFDRE